MNLELTADQTFMRDEARRLLAERADSASVRKAVEQGGFDAGLWRSVAAELGWCAVAIPERHGGLGLGPTELALLLEETGRRLAPVPLWSTAALTVPLIAALAKEEACATQLADIAAGAAAAVALPRLSGADPLTGLSVAATPAGEGYVLDGKVSPVADLAAADLVLVPAKLESGIALFALRAGSGFGATALETLDLTRPLGELTLDRLEVPADARIDDGGLQPGDFHAPLLLARLALAAEQVGAAQGALDLTLAYISERVQFGRTIASFQAVKHRCAKLVVDIAEARSLLYGAAAGLAAGSTGAGLEIDALGVLASETLWRCAEEAIQLHGGVGNTFEYDPHLYLRRAQASAFMLGSAAGRLERIADVVSFPPSIGGEVARRAGVGVESFPGTDLDIFRGEVAGWMAAHLTGRFAVLKDRGHAGDGEALPELRKEWERELAAGGWTCPGWPSRHGGREFSIAEQVVFQEEYARAGGPGRMGHIGEGLIGPTLIAFGTEEQKSRFLPRIRSGTEFWCQGYSEPEAGSDLANVKTRARRDPATGDWLVSGQKVWTSLAHLSDWIFVLARCEEGSAGPKGLIFLLMPLAQPGVTIHPIRQIGGGSEFNSVFFDNARASSSCVVGAPGEGWKIATALLSFERGISTLGQQMGFARELDLIVELAGENGAAADPAIRARLARAWAGLRAMRYMAVRMLAENPPPDVQLESLGYKYHWSNWHRDIGRLGMDVLGFDGAVVDADPRREKLRQLFFFTRADTVYGGANEIQLNIIAERGLGMPREPRGKPEPHGPASSGKAG
jgi:alkylation response protein AidB-like acyl-CoA dehydrogenase